MIALTGAEDWRGKLPTRDYTRLYNGILVPHDSYGNRRTLTQIEWLVVHHTGVGAARPSIQDIAAFQVGPTAQLPFPGFAYGGNVAEDGTFQVAYDLEVVTWAQGDGSPTSINGVGSNNYFGYAVVFSGENPTDAQLATYHRIHIALAAPSVLGRVLAVRGHRQVSGSNDTECPADAMIAAIAAGEI